jgi:hypothetical protein
LVYRASRPGDAEDQPFISNRIDASASKGAKSRFA